MRDEIKILRNIQNYSKERKKFLIDEIEKINWDTTFNAEEFLQLLISNDVYEKEWALTKMVVYMPYSTIRRIVTKDFLIQNVTDKMLDTAFPKNKRENLKNMYKRIQNDRNREKRIF